MTLNVFFFTKITIEITSIGFIAYRASFRMFKTNARNLKVIINATAQIAKVEKTGTGDLKAVLTFTQRRI